MGFKHPPLSGCNYRTWNMLFQLLFAVGEKVELSANENYIPDLRFYDSALGNCSMVNLTRTEFKLVLSHLTYKAFADIAVKLSGMDIDEELREELILDFPMRLLCSEDCPGLCPKCGKPRREGDCGCDLTERDPRWDVLRNYFSEEK
jgi:hypothetical protein